MSKSLEHSIITSRLDYTIEHTINHNDLMVSSLPDMATIAMVIRGRCRIISSSGVREIPELTVYLRDGSNEVIEYITNCTGVFEQVAVHINTKKLFATDCYVEEAAERRFEHAILRALILSTPIDGIASECCMSLSTFKRHFRARFNLSPHRLLLAMRLYMVRALLSRNELSTEYVTRMFGFNNGSYFISIFRDRFGATPTCARQISRYRSGE